MSFSRQQKRVAYIAAHSSIMTTLHLWVLRGAAARCVNAPVSLAPARRPLGSLYRIPEIVTLGRFPGGGESDSRWRTREVRHVGSDTLTPGFSCVAAPQFRDRKS